MIYLKFPESGWQETHQQGKSLDDKSFHGQSANIDIRSLAHKTVNREALSQIDHKVNDNGAARGKPGLKSIGGDLYEDILHVHVMI